MKTNLKAVHGLYNSKTNELELSTASTSCPRAACTPSLTRANVLTKDNVVISKEPVDGRDAGPDTIHSNEMTLHNKTHEVDVPQRRH